MPSGKASAGAVTIGGFSNTPTRTGMRSGAADAEENDTSQNRQACKKGRNATRFIVLVLSRIVHHGNGGLDDIGTSIGAETGIDHCKNIQRGNEYHLNMLILFDIPDTNPDHARPVGVINSPAMRWASCCAAA